MPVCIDSHFSLIWSDDILFYYPSQILDDAVASREDDGIKAVDVQLGQVLHLSHSLTVTEAGRLHHHVPMQRPEIIINTIIWS